METQDQQLSMLELILRPAFYVSDGRITKEMLDEISVDVRDAAYAIIDAKKATY